MSFVEFNAVTKMLGARTVVSEVSLQIERGERLVLRGPSGCGKTTILRLVAGLDTPDAGTILIDGTIASSAGKILVEPEERNIGMVFQDLALWPHMSVRENLMFGLKSRQIPPADAEERITKLIQRVGLSSRTNAKPNQLSGGEQQRVALARALVLQPLILLMDEPLSSLNDELKERIIADLIDLHDSLSFTLLFVTHDRAEADAIGTRICTMEDGRLTVS